ncbi:hypothetical protein, partial [Roseateles sp.]|uniref:hypothetical protein n=1 Tax=Roseateles sp. TaxID=1971397 RepID=UPI0037C9E05A
DAQMHPKPAADDDTGVTKPLQSAPSTTGGALCRASLVFIMNGTQPETAMQGSVQQLSHKAAHQASQLGPKS